MYSKLFTWFIVSLLIFSSCKQNPEKENVSKIATEQTVVADTIVYDVLIKNPDPLDEWTEQCLSNLDKDYLVDQLFDAVYAEKLQAYDFFKDEILSINNIKDLEKLEEFDRSKIARVQFEEIWLFDETNLTMTKKVHSIMIAYELLNTQEEIKGYKPAFKVYFKN